MIPHRELPGGGTIEDRIPKRDKPKTAFEAIQYEIEDWEISIECYKECMKECSTYMELYALKGSIILVKGFISSLKHLKAKVVEIETRGESDDNQPKEGPRRGMD